MPCRNLFHADRMPVTELTGDLAEEASKLDLSEIISSISPRAIAIPLLLSRELGIASYCSGRGGVGYLIDAVVISKHLDIDWPLTIVWSSKDVYQGIAQNQALTATHMQITEAERRLQDLHSMNNEYKTKILEHVTKRGELVKANVSLHNILEYLFQLKEDQRRVRKEIKIIEKAIRIMIS